MLTDPESQSATLLYIGSESERADALRERLEERNIACSVERVETTDEIATAIQQRQLTAIVAEYSLPGSDGISALERCLEARSDIPTVLLAEQVSPSLVERAYEVVDEFVHDTNATACRAVEHLETHLGTAEITGDLDVANHVETLAATTSDAIISIDTSSTIRYANPAVADIFGYDPEEIVGEPLTVLMSDDLATRHHEGMREYLVTGDRTLDWNDIELPGRHKNGSEIPLSISFSEFTSDSTQYFTGVIRDIRERKQLEAERELYHDTTQRILQCESLEDGLRVALDAIGSAMNWEYGEAWMRGEGDRLERVSDRYVASDAGAAFAEVTPSVIAERDDNLVGRVWESGIYEWDSDITSDDVEFERTAAAAEAGLQSALGVPIVSDGTVVAVVVFFLSESRDPDEAMIDATQAIAADLGHLMNRLQAESAVREERNIKNRILETSPVGIAILEADGTVRYVNDRAVQLFDLGEYEEPLTYEDIGIELVTFDGEPVSDGNRPRRRVIEDGEEISGEARVNVDGKSVWLSIRGTPLRDEDGHVTASLFSLQDISDQKRREDRLVRLNEIGQSLTEAETPGEVADIIVQGAREILDLPLTTVEYYDEEAGRLQIGRRTAELVDLIGDRPLFDSEHGLAWQAFAEHDERVIADIADETAVDADATVLESTLIFPIGSNGVFIAGAPAPDAFTETDVEIARILVANTAAALDRVDREQELHDAKEALEEYTDSLERLNRLNSVIRNLTQRLTQASTRDEIETAVCEELGTVTPYVFAWIGEQRAVDDALHPRTWTGRDAGGFDASTLPVDDETATGPARTAIRTRDPAVENNLQADPPFEPWRTQALQRGYRASIAVPLTYRDTLYGVLTLYAEEPDVFDDMEITVLKELGEMVGYAINAIERKKALVSDAAVELTFELDDPSVLPIQCAREADATFEFEALVEQSDATLRIFFTVSGVDPETVSDVCGHSPIVQHVSLLAEREGEYQYEAVVSEGSFLGTLISYGAHPTEMRADPAGGEVTVELPQSGDVQSFIRMFTSEYDGAKLLSRKQFDRPVQTREQFKADYKERLTERQIEVLKTAYFSGFFEQPRVTSGKELAAKLGVSQPTINRHIRTGERKLFDVVFDPD